MDKNTAIKKKVNLSEALEMLEKVTNSLDLVLDWYCDLADVYVEDDDEVRGIAERIKEARELLEASK